MSTKSEQFTALYSAERARLERQIFRRVGCSATALDLVHDIFLRLWERTTERTGNDAAYLNRCARNAAVDHIRADRRSQDFFANVLPGQYAASPASPHDELQARQSIGKIDAVLAALPKKTRHIFLLNRIHGRSFSEIASVFGLSQRAVAKHMARAVAACEKVV